MGCITDGGELFWNKQLQSAGMEITCDARGNARVVSLSKSDSGVPMADVANRMFGDGVLNVTDIINPPHSFEVLDGFLTHCDIHASCIGIKARDYAYHGWKLVTRDGLDNAGVDSDDLVKAQNEVKDFLSSCSDDGESIDELVYSTSVDYEAFGLCAIEVVRNLRGFVSKLRHVPIKNLVVLKAYSSGEKSQHFALCNSNGMPYKYFVKYMYNVDLVVKDKTKFDPYRASIDSFPAYSDRKTAVKWATGRLYSQTQRGVPVRNPRQSATEIVLLARPPKTDSAIFGTPSAVAAHTAMTASLHTQHYNMQFFKNSGVPRVAIVVTGALGSGSTDEDGDEDDMVAYENAIREFFVDHVQNSSRSVLYMSLPEGVEVKFEKLSPESVDASFIQYTTQLDDRVRIAHEMPGEALGWGTTNNLGGNSTKSQMMRYRDHIVTPGQRVFSNFITRIIWSGMLIPYFRFELKLMPVDDELQRKEFTLKEYVDGAITNKEYRDETGRQALTDGEGDIGDSLLVRSAQITVIPREGNATTTLPGQELPNVKVVRGGARQIGGDRETEEEDDTE